MLNPHIAISRSEYFSVEEDSNVDRAAIHGDVDSGI